MPGGDGTGPSGRGPRGGGGGRRRRFGRKGAGAGPGGSCICPECGYRTPHRAGVPCSTVFCPRCSVHMIKDV